ncbi:cation:proton antiporter [Roseococcus suduntuyensis]|uniref:Kef-type K+ transport system membrane component KefB n=1 Tax=Roseococcus suduntuyensis TaxID=455361 RepID=A0A840AFU7_9PROT|nr:cation:proton antiporter [Roseococcus suduntuyensis]MBB3899406.1 Kef-type K+ transport system membrane component KefB [Roseococcus suduntuyensis]
MLAELPIEDVILQFAVVITAALVVQLLFERTRVPGLIGLILLGMAIGPGGAGVLPEGPVVELFGSIGLLYIMFLAGVEIDLDLVRERKREALGFGTLAFVLSFAPAFGAGLVFGLGLPGALLLGAALASHTLVAYPMISRMGLAGRRPIVAATGGTLLTDTFSLLVLVAVIRIAGGEGGWSWLVPVAALAALSAAALLLIPRLARLILAAEKHTAAEKALFLLAVLLLLAVAAEAIGTEDILGAFLAGLCLNRALHRREELKENLEFVGRMLFVPFFFVETGMRLRLDALESATTWLFALALVAVIVVSKSLAAAIAARLFGYSRTEGLAMASLSFPQAAATLAVVVIGMEMDLIEAVTADAIIIVIFLTCLLGPLLTRHAARKMAG